MRSLLLALVAASASIRTIHAQEVATMVVYVTVPSSITPAQTAELPRVNTIDRQQDEKTTSSTSISQATSTSSSNTLCTTTQPTLEAASSQTISDMAASATTASTYYEPGASSLGAGQIDTEGGASGSDTASFKLSKGGLAAILIVVILVSLFGIASIVLFVIAKRRQWTMRQTLTRASRRLTGRVGQSRASRPVSTADRKSRRTGIRLDSPPRPGVKAVYPPGHKRGLVVDVRDPEKGPKPLDGKAPENTNPRENTWVKKLWGDGWK